MHRNVYDISGTVKTTDATAVSEAVIELFRQRYPRGSAALLHRAFRDAGRFYCGGDLAYWPCDTEYHDIQHVLEVTLAMARLMHGYEERRAKGDDPLTPELFIVGVVSALFHDFGYLRKRNDHRHRYGAEYTVTHVSRGALFLRSYASEVGLEAPLARLAATLVHFTGYERDASSIRIAGGLPRRLGQMLGTADIMAQMADRCYLEKCRDRLHPEFVLGRLGAPRGARRLPLFKTGDDLIAKTPAFYVGAARRLERELGAAHEYAACHFGGANPYVEAMRRNAVYAGSGKPVLRRRPPHTLLPDIEPYPRDLVGLPR